MENSTRNKCSIAECDRKCKSRTSELCQSHYDRQYRLSHPRRSLRPPVIQRICSFEGCTEVFSARNLCARHYRQRQRGNNLKPLLPKRINYKRPSQSMTIVERLMARVERVQFLLPNLELPCLLWTGAQDSRGYGTVSVAGKIWSVHRLVHFLATGDSPPVVRHRCDHPACIEPTHLIGGTAFDNVADRIERGRSADRRGENNTQARLTWEKVRQIRSDSRLGYVIALDYGLSRAAISLVKNGHTWKE